MSVAYVALGANLGEPLPMLRWAKEQLAELGDITSVSRLYRTAPIGGPAGQPDYLNAALRLQTALAPADLLAALHGIEADAGRQRRERWEARVLDLDLIAYDDLISTGTPQLPHPRAWERAFVLAPLADLDPLLKHPQSGESVAEAFAKAEKGGIKVMLAQW